MRVIFTNRDKNERRKEVLEVKQAKNSGYG